MENMEITHRSGMKLYSTLVLLLMGIIFLSGCVSQQPPQPAATPTALITPTGVILEFTIRESNFKLSPANVTVNKGDAVKIIVINDQGTHNLFVEGYNQRIKIVSAGNTQVMEFVADKTGTFNMWCEVPNHRNLGMKGQLIVS